MNNQTKRIGLPRQLSYPVRVDKTLVKANQTVSEGQPLYELTDAQGKRGIMNSPFSGRIIGNVVEPGTAFSEPVGVISIDSSVDINQKTTNDPHSANKDETKESSQSSQYSKNVDLEALEKDFVRLVNSTSLTASGSTLAAFRIHIANRLGNELGYQAEYVALKVADARLEQQWRTLTAANEKADQPDEKKPVTPKDDPRPQTQPKSKKATEEKSAKLKLLSPVPCTIFGALISLAIAFFSDADIVDAMLTVGIMVFIIIPTILIVLTSIPRITDALLGVVCFLVILAFPATKVWIEANSSSPKGAIPIFIADAISAVEKTSDSKNGSVAPTDAKPEPPDFAKQALNTVFNTRYIFANNRKAYFESEIQKAVNEQKVEILKATAQSVDTIYRWAEHTNLDHKRLRAQYGNSTTAYDLIRDAHLKICQSIVKSNEDHLKAVEAQKQFLKKLKLTIKVKATDTKAAHSYYGLVPAKQIEKVIVNNDTGKAISSLYFYYGNQGLGLVNIGKGTNFFDLSDVPPVFTHTIEEGEIEPIKLKFKGSNKYDLESISIWDFYFFNGEDQNNSPRNMIKLGQPGTCNKV